MSNADLEAVIKLDTTCIKLYKVFLKCPLYPSDCREKTLFVYGTNDLFVSQSVYKEIKPLNDNQQKYLVPNGGHFGGDTAQQYSADLIRKFIYDIEVL